MIESPRQNGSGFFRSLTLSTSVKSTAAARDSPAGSHAWRAATWAKTISNILALVLMVVSLALVSRWPGYRWMLTAIAGVTLLNGVSHAIACVITRSYSPGTITGMLFWLPLGVFILGREWRDTPLSTFRAGVIGAVGLHIMVCVLAMYG